MAEEAQAVSSISQRMTGDSESEKNEETATVITNSVGDSDLPAAVVCLSKPSHGQCCALCLVPMRAGPRQGHGLGLLVHVLLTHQLGQVLLGQSVKGAPVRAGGYKIAHVNANQCQLYATAGWGKSCLVKVSEGPWSGLAAARLYMSMLISASCTWQGGVLGSEGQAKLRALQGCECQC